MTGHGHGGFKSDRLLRSGSVSQIFRREVIEMYAVFKQPDHANETLTDSLSERGFIL